MTTRPNGLRQSGFKAGVYYTTYLNPIAQALQNISAAAKNRGTQTALSIEDILRSDDYTIGEFQKEWY